MLNQQFNMIYGQPMSENNRYRHAYLFVIMSQPPLKFKFSGKLARLLGRESVSSDTAALFELVKNGYDADATKVTVTFENLIANDGKNATITIEDSGEGMTYDDIVNKWMEVGTYSKEHESITKGGRTVVGNKGVGRFATEKLAEWVTVISWPKETNEEIKMEIDWTKFEGEEIQFGDVEIPNEIKSNRADPDKHGLKIILRDLREQWNEKKIQRLRASVSSIMLPPELQTVGKNFAVEIHSDDFEQESSQRVESVLFEKAPYSISTRLPYKASQTTVQIKREGKIIERKRISCEGQEIHGGNAWKSFGGCEVQIYVYPYTTQHDPWNEYYKLLNLGYVKEIVRKNCGLKIYRDGFWVSPYGGPGNDWMGLDADRVQSNLKMGNTQIIGFVKISKEKNKEIRDTTSRERLEENVAFHSLKYFIKCVCDEFFEVRKKEVKVKKTQKTRVHGQAIHSALDGLIKEIDSNRQIDAKTKTSMKKSIKDVKNIAETFRKQSASEYADLETQQRMYRSLAALGISSAASYHEIFNIVAGMGMLPKIFRRKFMDNNVNDEEVNISVNNFEKSLKTITRHMWFVRRFVLGIGSIAEKPKKEKINLKNEIESLWHEYAGLSNTDVVLDVQCYPNDLAISINQTDFFSVVLNMFTNSFKALDKRSHRDRKIKLTASRTATNLEIRFSDNGIGIDENIQDKIFRPLWSGYDDGTGMGLAIVSEVLANYEGKIEHVPNSELDNGATFLVVIPWGNVKDG